MAQLLNDCGRPLAYVDVHGNGTATFSNPTDPSDRATYKISPETAKMLNGTRTSKQAHQHWEDAQEHRDDAIARVKRQREEQEQRQQQMLRVRALQQEMLTDAQILRAKSLIEATVGVNTQVTVIGRTFVVMSTHSDRLEAMSAPIPYGGEILIAREVTRDWINNGYKSIYTIAFTPEALTPPEMAATYTREELEEWSRPELQRLLKQLHAQLEVEAQIRPELGRHYVHTGRKATRASLVDAVLLVQQKLQIQEEVAPCILA